MANKSSPKSTVPLISAVVRVLSVLEKLSLRRTVGLEELSREIRLAKSTVYRFLLTLQELGYARRAENDRWAITLRMFNVGSRALDHLDLHAAARPVAEELAEEVGETVHMGVLDGDAAVYVLKIESKYRIRMYSRVGGRMPLYSTAIGKVLLACMTPEEREAALENVRLLPFTRNTITSRAALDAEIARTRERGYGLDNRENEEDLHCISAPIFDYTGAIVAALSVSWPGFRYEREDEAEKIRQVKTAAARISAMLGHET
ncbi:MAG: helix-turn-helix domain-containing protein [Candidatus Accumulibacter sp.]|jgi:IclR family KDG regulon transcriptional repressor|nr:helix-turn-helix domain-containing protein [Accumulibacter sp.]